MNVEERILLPPTDDEIVRAVGTAHGRSPCPVGAYTAEILAVLELRGRTIGVTTLRRRLRSLEGRIVGKKWGRRAIAWSVPEFRSGCS